MYYHSLPVSSVVAKNSQRSLDQEFGWFQMSGLAHKFKASSGNNSDLSNSLKNVLQRGAMQVLLKNSKSPGLTLSEQKVCTLDSK